jgi:hypothetical protein
VFDLGRLLLVLNEEQVEFIIVGGVAAALQGAPVLTQDIDILYRIEDGNLERLERALSRLHAVARGDSRNLPFGKSQLMTTGHKLALTDAGALDLLASINDSLFSRRIRRGSRRAVRPGSDAGIGSRPRGAHRPRKAQPRRCRARTSAPSARPWSTPRRPARAAPRTRGRRSDQRLRRRAGVPSGGFLQLFQIRT